MSVAAVASPVGQCSEVEARELTDRIRSTAETLWGLLLEANTRGAWAALGYGSWREYATAEFGMSQSYAYRVLDQAKVIGEINVAIAASRQPRPISPSGEKLAPVSPIGRPAAAAPRSTDVETPAAEVTEAAARDIKPRLEQVTEKIRDRVTPDVPAEKVQEIVDEIVHEERAKAADAKQIRAEQKQLMERVNPPGFDPARDLEFIEERGAVHEACDQLLALGDPAEFWARHNDYAPDMLRALAADVTAAYGWLASLIEEMNR